MNGLCYLQVLSVSHPNGAIRGQVLADHGFAVQLSGSTGGLEGGSAASGMGVFRFDPGTGSFSARILHALTSATSISFHGPKREDGAYPLLLQGPAFNGRGQALLETNLVLSADVAAALQLGDLSVRVSSSVPEIAGLMHVVDPDPVPVLTAQMDSQQVVILAENDFLGCAVCTYNDDTGEMQYWMTHSVIGASANFLTGGAGPGTNGVVVAELPASPTSVRGTLQLDDLERRDLFRGLMQFSVHNAEFPGGAIRGQILDRTEFYALLAGKNVVPPVTTRERGIALFRFDQQRHELVYDIVHDVPGVTEVRLVGRAGSPFQSITLSTNALQEVRGRYVFNYKQWQALVSGSLSVCVSSGAYPSGKIQAVIRRVGGAERPSYVLTFTLGGSVSNLVSGNDYGVALLGYDCARRRLSYTIAKDPIMPPRVLLLRNAPSLGLSNALVARLGDGDWIEGCVSIPDPPPLGFGSGEYRLELASELDALSNISGAVLDTKLRFSAQLQGRQNVPPTSVDAKGLSVFEYDRTTRALRYLVWYTGAPSLSANLFGPADPGASGNLIHATPGFSYRALGDFILTPAQGVALLQGRLYVVAADMPFGRNALRGQIESVWADDDCNGVPNEWERRYGLSAGAYDDMADSDNDGRTVIEEFLRDSDPGSSNLPSTVRIQRSASAVLLSSESMPERQYVFEARQGLDYGSWEALTWPRYSDTNIIEYAETNVSRRTFYRVNPSLPHRLAP